MQKKLSFRSVLSLVIGSQIGSGIFLLPSSLATIGPISLFGWLFSGTGAIFLALIFAALSRLILKGGGPHVYIEKAFGRNAAFFTAWTYWLVSWVSSIAVIVAAVGYLAALFTFSHPLLILFVEILILISITSLNIRGAVIAGSLELLFTLLKTLPLILIPIFALFYLDSNNFYPINPHHLPLFSSLNTATLMTFWGFIGVETATTTSAIIENPSKTIPKAIILGTLIVAAIYFINSFAIMGVLSADTLVNTGAPYAVATQVLFGKGWDIAISIIAFIACLGTLNAWVLTSGQIAQEAAKDRLFPPLFAKKNTYDSPYISLLIPMLCTLPLLFFTLTPNILQQLNTIIDISVLTFVFVYLAAAISFVKITYQEKSLAKLIGAFFSILFCLWILVFTSWYNLLACSLFVITGLPVYLWQKRGWAGVLAK